MLQKGYEVDIVAGSSLKMVELDVEGIGLVQSPWTTLGVAQALVNNWDYMTLVTTVLFLSFAGIWLMTRLVFERNMLEQENELLTIIGWQDNKITFRNRVEQYILLFIAYLLSIPVIEIFSLEKSAYIISTTILIFGVLLIYLVLNRIPIREARTTHKRMTSTSYYWSIIYPIVIILILSTVLLSIQLSSITSVFVSSRETFLGQFLLEETLMFQLFTIIATILLSIVSLSESFQALLFVRREEFSMYKIIGWTKKRILSHLLKEISKWSGATLLISLVISLMVQYLLGLQLTLSLFGSIFSVFLLYFFVFLLVVTNRSLSLAIKDKNTRRRLSPKRLLKYMGAIGVSLTLLYIVAVNIESEQVGDFTTEKLRQKSNIKSEKESSLVPSKQLSATSGARGKYKIDLKLDELNTFHINAEVNVQNLSTESWKDVGFYFIPNALTEENKPEYISDATNLQIKSISDGEDIPYELRDNELLLKLKEKVEPGETKKIKIEYSLQVSEEGVRLRKDEGGYYLAQWYPMLGYYDGGWNIHDFNPEGESYHTDYGDYEVAFNLPQDFFIASSGLEGKVESMSSGIIHAKQVKDFYLALLKPDKWTSETTKINDTSIRVFLPVNESNNMDKTLQVSLDAFRYFEEKLGDNPFKELDVIGNHKHMEYPNVVEVSSTMEHVIVHEIAHQWFYYLVQNDPFNEGWLDEGLANFVSSIYLTEKYGDPKYGYEHPIRMAERQSTSKIVNLSLDQFEKGEYVPTVYGRVPLLLRDFFEKNGGGEEALQFLSLYIEKYRFKNVSSKDFAEYFIEHFGEEHEEFITEWLEV
ncbi:M1 family aminopeptidase [Psychrobacillus sp. BL-248-WT-3]|uniref:M1 family aminopeptidase n=1 Tax=Psychrobacillus sp. BL-248-WT-3 TaxID=2725306 RepID=UPI00146EC149|nr:M1 family aminopeptidase [Psychrobacillus sp. BL-248-WT-3]